jgi:hypothetical protein
VLDGDSSSAAAAATASGHTGNSTSSHYADRGRYDAVKFAAALAACDLNSDVRRLPNGIETEIGKLNYYHSAHAVTLRVCPVVRSLPCISTQRLELKCL